MEYLLTQNPDQLFPNESGSYTVELNNSVGCYYTDTFHIQVSYPSPTIL